MSQSRSGGIEEFTVSPHREIVWAAKSRRYPALASTDRNPGRLAVVLTPVVARFSHGSALGAK